jgi:hypothetical protein
MKMPDFAFSFDALARAGSEESCLAYWIGTCDVRGLEGVGAIGITVAMSYQYDMEEQADRTGHVLARDADWRARFAPVAPVQLTRAWSPLPAAVEALGRPDWTSVEPDGLGTHAAVCAWSSVDVRRLSATPLNEPDHERFRRLLAVTAMRAGNANRGVLIAAKPGWSYEKAHELSAVTRKLMERAGFVVTDRHA